MNLVTPSVSCGPSERLFKLVKLGLSISEGMFSPLFFLVGTSRISTLQSRGLFVSDEQDRPITLEGDNIAPGTGIDLEIESESKISRV